MSYPDKLHSYVPLNRLSRFLTIVLCIGILFNLISIAMSIILFTASEGGNLGLNSNTTNGSGHVSIFSSNFTYLYGALYSIVFLTISIIFLYWFYRSYNNLYSLEVHGLKFSPIKAVAYCIIPIINLWKPYYIMKEIWTFSQATGLSNEFSLSDSNSNVKRWWVLSLFSIFFPFIGGSLFPQTISNVITNIALILASVMLISLSKEITIEQEKRYNSVNNAR
jgi:Domain of unknown function (DUF4328)